MSIRSGLLLSVCLAALTAVPMVGAPAPASAQNRRATPNAPAPAPMSADEPERRQALVVGNGAYQGLARLPTPAGDARLVAEALRRSGFRVTEGIDLDERGLRRTVREFVQRVGDAGPDAVAFVYLSGHGLVAEGSNFFLPVDARLQRPQDVGIHGLAVDDVMSTLAATPSRLRVVLIDASRAASASVNPGQGGAELGAGLGSMLLPEGVVAGLSAQPGAQVINGGQNSAYASSLAKYLAAPGLHIEEVLRQVRCEVYTTTQGGQIPWSTITFTGTFIPNAGAPRLPDACGANLDTLVASAGPGRATAQGGPATRVAVTDIPIPRARPRGQTRVTRERLRTLPPEEGYRLVVEEGSVDAYETFVETYPQDPRAGRFRDRVRARQDTDVWIEAVEENTPQAYERYLRRFPYGGNRRQALARLDRFGVAAPDLPPPTTEIIERIERPRATIVGPGVFVPRSREVYAPDVQITIDGGRGDRARERDRDLDRDLDRLRGERRERRERDGGPAATVETAPGAVIRSAPGTSTTVIESAPGSAPSTVTRTAPAEVGGRQLRSGQPSGDAAPSGEVVRRGAPAADAPSAAPQQGEVVRRGAPAGESPSAAPAQGEVVRRGAPATATPSAPAQGEVVRRGAPAATSDTPDPTATPGTAVQGERVRRGAPAATATPAAPTQSAPATSTQTPASTATPRSENTTRTEPATRTLSPAAQPDAPASARDGERAADRPARGERALRGERPDAAERPDRPDRGERPGRADRPDRGAERLDGAERPSRAERLEGDAGDTEARPRGATGRGAGGGDVTRGGAAGERVLDTPSGARGAGGGADLGGGGGGRAVGGGLGGGGGGLGGGAGGGLGGGTGGGLGGGAGAGGAATRQ